MCSIDKLIEVDFIQSMYDFDVPVFEIQLNDYSL